MIKVLFLAADPTNASRLRLGEELREIREKLQLSKWRDQFELYERMSVRPTDISQALLDVNPQIVHFSGHGTSTGTLCVENRIGQVHPIQPETLAALFGLFASEVNCVVLNACYSEIQAQAIAKNIRYVIGMSQAISDKAAVAFSVGFYQALGAGRSIEDAYQLGTVQIGLENIPDRSTPVLKKSDLINTMSTPLPSKSPARQLHANLLVVNPPAVPRPYNLSFEMQSDSGEPVGWFNSLGFVDYVSFAYKAITIKRPEENAGTCVLFQNPSARQDEFGSLMQRCPAPHLAGKMIRLEGEISTRDIEQWAGLWLRADGDRKFNLFFDNMSNKPIRGSTMWKRYNIEAQLPHETTWLNYGIVLEGRGMMWADNFRILVWNEGRWEDV